MSGSSPSRPSSDRAHRERWCDSDIAMERAPMNLIERAGNQLRLKSAKSMIEKAADRIGGPSAAAPETMGAAAPNPASYTISQPKVVRRETRRQVTIDF